MTFCICIRSLLIRFSQFSCDVLKQDFRQGLKDMDGEDGFLRFVTNCSVLSDATAEQRNPDTFDPSVDIRGKPLPRCLTIRSMKQFVRLYQNRPPCFHLFV
jgi:hypothetical protein